MDIQQDFSKPQKQSASGIVVMFANSFQKIIRAIALPLLFILVKSKNGGHLTLILISCLILLTVVLAIYAYISYHKFTFFLDEEKQEFIINEGIFNKSTLTIQLNKIQQVNINQSLLQQMIGVYSLDIDTAGSEKKEASIKAIDHATAMLLKQRLLSKSVHQEAIFDSANPEADISFSYSTPPLLKLSIPTLFKVGITSNYGASLLLLSGFFFGLIQLFRDYISAFEIESNQIDQALDKGFSVFSICFLIIMALIIILGTNIIRTFVRYFNFQILKQKHSLAISSGLFTKKNTLLRPNKVQLSAYSQNYFQKRFNLLNMKIKQAAYSVADKEESKKSDIEIPGCDQAEKNEILKMIFHQIPVKGKRLLPNYRFVVLQSMIWIVIPFLIFLWLSLSFQQQLQQYLLLCIPYALIVGTMLSFEFKRHRLYVNELFIIKRSGIWDVEHEIIEPHKIQAITAKQYFWHKKADIGHLILHTAAGIIHFRYGNYKQINQLINYWMYQVESTKKDWN